MPNQDITQLTPGTPPYPLGTLFEVDVPTLGTRSATLGDILDQILDAGIITLGTTEIALGSTTTTVAGLTLSGGTLSGTTTLTDMTAGSILFAGASGVLSQDNANLFWDDTNNRLGIGGVPAAQLHLQGNTSLAAATNGIVIRSAAATHTDTASSGSVTTIAANSLLAPTFAASNPVTYEQPATLLIQPPIAGSNVTLTNRHALRVLGNSGGEAGTAAPFSITLWDNGTGATWDLVNPFAGYDFGSNDGSGVGVGTRVRLGAVMEVATGNTTRFGIFTAPTIAGTLVERLSVLSGGNVGIGISVPNKLLDVNGDASLNSGGAARSTRTNVIGSGDSGTTGGYRASIAFVPVGANGFQTAISFRNHLTDIFNAAHTERMRVHSTGVIGIGDFSSIVPQANLHVGGAARTLRVDNVLTDAANGDWGEFSWSNNVLIIGTNQLGSGVARNVNLRRGGVEFLNAGSVGLKLTAGCLALSADGSLGATAAELFRLGGVFSLANLTSNGIIRFGVSQTITDTGSTGTVSLASVNTFGIPTVNASNVVIFTRAATFRIAGAPIAGTNVTFTNPYALEISTGNMFLTGDIHFSGSTSTFPALKRNAAALEHRLADGSAYGPMAASELRQAAGENGNLMQIQSLTELTTIAAAATTDTTIQIPANAIVIAVSVRVTTAIPTAATFDIGVSGATARYGTGISTAANTISPGTLDNTRYYSVAAAIRITPNLTPADATGRVRVTIHYIAVTPPTS
jgi:hypothetical protein